MGKYEPLGRWLSVAEEDNVRLSLADIERIVGLILPESARRYQAFWAGSAVDPELRRVGWHAYPRLAESAVSFRRLSSEESANAMVLLQSPAPGALPGIIFLGCVKSKRTGRWPARSLYISPLFRGRMAYAESTGRPWFVLSAKHGIVSPDEEVEDYDVSLLSLTAAEREEWARRALAGIDAKCGSLSGKVVEIHAGQEYRAAVLLKGIRDRGGTVTVPLSRLRFGEQLAWYTRATQSRTHVTTESDSHESLDVTPPVTRRPEAGAMNDGDDHKAIDAVPRVARLLSLDFMANRRRSSPRAAGSHAEPAAVVVATIRASPRSTRRTLTPIALSGSVWQGVTLVHNGVTGRDFYALRGRELPLPLGDVHLASVRLIEASSRIRGAADVDFPAWNPKSATARQPTASASPTR